MFKRTLSIFLSMLMLISCCGVTSMAADTEYPANSLFAINSSPVKDGMLRYTINITAQQNNIAGAVILVEYDSNVLRPVLGCGPVTTETANSGTVKNFEGEYVHGVTEDNSNMYSIAYVNTTAQSTGTSAKAFFNMIFEVVDDSRPLTDVRFYCAEYYSTSESEKNITKQQLIKEYVNIATLESPKMGTITPSADGFTLTWHPVMGADGYAIYRSTPEQGRTFIAETVGRDSTTYTDSGLKSGVNYTYTITAINDSGESSYDSNGLSAKFIAKPEIEYVKNVDGGVEIRWNACEGAVNYYIMRREAGKTDWEKIAIRSANLDTFYKDRNVVDGVEYEYDINSATDLYESVTNSQGEKIIYVKTPELLSVSNTFSGIELKWSAHPKATSYVIYRRVIGVDDTLIRYRELNATSFVDTQVEPGSTYTYSIMVVTNSGNSAYNTIGHTITRVPATDVTSLVLNANSITVEWAKVDGVDGYVVYRKPVSSDTWQKVGTVKGDTTSIEDTGATSGTQYVYAVAPVKSNSEGVKNPSQVIYYIASPQKVNATNEVDGILVSWERVGGATSYLVFKDDGSGVLYSLGSVEGNSNLSFLDTSVNHGSSYTYTVVAVNNVMGESKESETSNTLIRWDEVVYATPSLADGGIHVEWDDSVNAQSYIVYRTSGEGWVPVAEVTDSHYLDEDVISDKEYSYAIGLVVSGSISVVHKPVDMQIRYIAPANNITTVNGSNYTKVSWNAVDGAQKYYLYKSTTEDGVYEQIGVFDSNVLSYVDTNISAGKTYYYSVRCYNGTVMSVYSDAKRNVFLEYPKIKSVVNVYEGQTFTWNAVAGATSYRVYVKIYGEKYYTYLTTVDAKTLSYTNTLPVNGKIMCYTVKAMNGDSASAYVAKCMTYVQAPKIAMSNSPSGVYLKWDKNDCAVGYWVYRKTPSAKYWTRIACVTTLYYTDTKVKSGTDYLYTVKTYSKSKILSGCNMDGWPIKHLATPKITSVVNGYGAVTCFWQTVPGAKSYNVYRKANNATSWTYIGNSTTYFFRDADVKSLSTYTYTVRAVNGSNVSSFNYTGKSVKYITAPTITISNSTSGVYLSWNRISGASSYYIYRKAGNAKSWTKITTVTGSSYLDTNVKAGVTYVYTIKAYGSKTLSGYNSYGWKTIYINTPKLVSALSYPDGVQLKWQKVPVATWYAVYRKAEGDRSWTLIGRTTGNGKVTYKDKATQKGVTYTYTVRACYGNYKSWFQPGISCEVNY